MIKKFRFLLIAALAALPLASAQDLTAAAASFPFPLYATMFDAYNQETGIQVNYQSIGSGGGQRQLLEQTIDFGGSDAPMTDEALAGAPASEVLGGPQPLLHITDAHAAAVPSHDIPGV